MRDAAAVRASRGVDVIVVLGEQERVDASVVGQLAQGIQQVCQVRRASLRRSASGRFQHQFHPRPIADSVALRGVPQSVVADLVKASWQDVLQESPEELDARQSLGSPGLGAGGPSSETSRGSGPCPESAHC